MFDTVLVGLLVLVVALWLVARIVHWLPAHYAKEEAAWLSAIRAGSNDVELPLSYEPPGTAALWRDFFCDLPPLNGRTLIALIGVVSVALWVYRIFGYFDTHTRCNNFSLFNYKCCFLDFCTSILDNCCIRKCISTRSYISHTINRERLLRKGSSSSKE